MVNGQIAKLGVFEHEGALYYALKDGGEIQTGKMYVVSSDTNGLVKAGWNYFSETGKLYNEVFCKIDDNLYYIVNGQITKRGVFELNGDLYYSDLWNGVVAANTTKYIPLSETNDLIIFGNHTFDENGKMIK